MKKSIPQLGQLLQVTAIVGAASLGYVAGLVQHSKVIREVRPQDPLSVKTSEMKAIFKQDVKLLKDLNSLRKSPVPDYSMRYQYAREKIDDDLKSMPDSHLKSSIEESIVALYDPNAVTEINSALLNLDHQYNSFSSGECS